MQPPTGPAMPAAWTPFVEAAARQHMIDVYPQEAAGIVIDGAYHRLPNTSKTPTDDVVLDEKALLAVGLADVFFHSHPDGIGSPSDTDMVYQQQLGIPFVISTWPVPDFFAFGDDLAPAPLIGRAFRHGVHDCYSLMRDWYRQRGIEVMNQPRAWEWWGKAIGQSLYMDKYIEAGFDLIPPAEAVREGDVVLMKFNNPVPMHGALVTDNPDLILHHPAGLHAFDRTRLSCLAPRHRYAPHFSAALRHPAL